MYGLIEKGEERLPSCTPFIEYIVAEAKSIVWRWWLQRSMGEGKGKKRVCRVKTPLALDAMVTGESQAYSWKQCMQYKSWKQGHEIELEVIRKLPDQKAASGELATSHILPAAIRYQNWTKLAGNKRIERCRPEWSFLPIKKQILERYLNDIIKTSDLVEKMIKQERSATTWTVIRTKAIGYQSQVWKDAFFDAISTIMLTKLELLVDDREWYLPK